MAEDLRYTKWTTAQDVADIVMGPTQDTSNMVGPVTAGSVIVTGSNSGIGFEAALVLRRVGYKVICCARSMAKATATCEKIESLMASDLASERSGSTAPGVVDLGDLDSVRAFTTSLKDKPVLCLLNNAGIMQLPKFTPSKQGFESQFAVNFLGPWLLTELLKPNLRAGARAMKCPARVVNVSSAAHYSSQHSMIPEVAKIGDPAIAREQYTNGWNEYATSKMYQIIHAQHIAETEKGTIAAFSLHPGVISTGLNRNAACCTFTRLLYCLPHQLYCCCCCCQGTIRKTKPQGAAPSVRACIDPALAPASGSYLHETCHPKAPRLLSSLDPGLLMERCATLCARASGIGEEYTDVLPQ